MFGRRKNNTLEEEFMSKAELAKYSKKCVSPIGEDGSDGPDNIIFSEEMRLAIFSAGRNNNVFVLGEPGSGGRFSYIVPNILQANTSYVIADYSGDLYNQYKGYLQSKGYEVWLLDLCDFANSRKYNPFWHVHGEHDVEIFVDTFFANTTSNGPEPDPPGDPEWENMERSLLSALVALLCACSPKKGERSFARIREMLSEEHNTRKNDGVSILDILFADFEKEHPDSSAVKKYNIFRLGPEKYKNGVLVSLAARLNSFALDKVSELMSVDEFDFLNLNSEKCAIFLAVPGGDTTYRFFSAIMCEQIMIEIAYTNWEKCQKEQRHPQSKTHVMLCDLLDIGIMPTLVKAIVTNRSAGFFCSVGAQNLTQLRRIYDGSSESASWDMIIGNCDTLVCLGQSRNEETLEWVSETLGEATTTITNTLFGTSPTKKQIQEIVAAKKEKYRAVLEQMHRNECIVHIRGFLPYFGKKYDTGKDPRFVEARKLWQKEREKRA